MKKICFIINKTVFFYYESNKIIYFEDGKEKKINLNVPASRCLMLLIDKRNTVVHRDEFISKVWNENGVVVANNTYYQNISILRKCLFIAGLGDETIVTIPKKGLILNDNIIIEKKITENNHIYIREKKIIGEILTMKKNGVNIKLDSGKVNELNEFIYSFFNMKVKLYNILLAVFIITSVYLIM